MKKRNWASKWEAWRGEFGTRRWRKEGEEKEKKKGQQGYTLHLLIHVNNKLKLRWSRYTLDQTSKLHDWALSRHYETFTSAFTWSWGASHLLFSVSLVFACACTCRHTKPIVVSDGCDFTIFDGLRPTERRASIVTAKPAAVATCTTNSLFFGVTKRAHWPWNPAKRFVIRALLAKVIAPKQSTS